MTIRKITRAIGIPPLPVPSICQTRTIFITSYALIVCRVVLKLKKSISRLTLPFMNRRRHFHFFEAAVTEGVAKIQKRLAYLLQSSFPCKPGALLIRSNNEQ